MASFFRLAALTLTLTFGLPAQAATVIYHFDGISRGTDIDSSLIGTVRFNLTEPLGRKPQGWGRGAKAHRNSMFESAAISLIPSRFPKSAYLMSGGRHAGFMLRGSVGDAVAHLDIYSVTGHRLWLRIKRTAPAQSHELTEVRAAQMISVPLPATFPLFLGLCLSAAFFQRRTRKKIS